MDLDTEALVKSLREAVEKLSDKRTGWLLTAIDGAITELIIGNQKDGDWEHARRAQHILSCALKWHEESAPRPDAGKGDGNGRG